MKFLDKCPICRSNQFRTLYSGLKDRIFEHNQKEFSVLQCMDCEIVFTNPQIEIFEYSKYYKTDEYMPFLPQKIRGYQLFSKLIHDTFSKVFINKIRGIIHPGLKILEIGCANGDFLLKCKNKGMDVIGVEIDEIVAKRAAQKGLIVLDMPFEEAYQHLKDQRFDIIFMSHVFEHFQEPTAVLTYARNILKEDGKIALIIPNIKSMTHYLFRKDCMHLDIPRHFFHYSPDGINTVAKISGLYVEKIRYVSGATSFLNSIVYKFHLKKFFPGNSYILRILFLPLIILLNFFKLGDEIAVFMRKN